MGKITVETCHIEGLKVITPTVFGDERGYFMETYNYNDYKAAGIDMEFVQDNQSSSRKGVLRGLHFQINYPQDKHLRSSWEILRADQPLRKLYGLLHSNISPDEEILSHAVTAVLDKGAEIIRLAEEERRKYENG